MLKTLLADRFQLKVHTETREMPIFALVVSRKDGQLGAKVTASTADCSKAEQERAEARATDRGAVAERLAAGRGLPCAIMPAPARVAGSMTMRDNPRRWRTSRDSSRPSPAGRSKTGPV